jgi:hypothetical protein
MIFGHLDLTACLRGTNGLHRNKPGMQRRKLWVNVAHTVPNAKLSANCSDNETSWLPQLCSWRGQPTNTKQYNNMKAHLQARKPLSETNERLDEVQSSSGADAEPPPSDRKLLQPLRRSYCNLCERTAESHRVPIMELS